MAIKHKNVVASWVFYVQLTKGMSKREIAGEIGIDHQTIYYWVNGASRPKACYLKRMVELSDGKFRPKDLRPDLF